MTTASTSFLLITSFEYDVEKIKVNDRSIICRNKGKTNSQTKSPVDVYLSDKLHRRREDEAQVIV